LSGGHALRRGARSRGVHGRSWIRLAAFDDCVSFVRGPIRCPTEIDGDTIAGHHRADDTDGGCVMFAHYNDKLGKILKVSVIRVNRL
jgi:hypothetical protein